MKVRLDPKKCTKYLLSDSFSTGVIGQVYTIEKVDSTHACLYASNWHKLEWLTIVGVVNKIGGKLNDRRV